MELRSENAAGPQWHGVRIWFNRSVLGSELLRTHTNTDGRSNTDIMP